MTLQDFKKYTLEKPSLSEVREQYTALESKLDPSQDAAVWIETIRSWDELRKQLYDWIGLVEIRFHQDTQDPKFKEAKQHCDELRPLLTELAVGFKRRLLEPPYRQVVLDEFGSQVVELWQCDIAAFDPVISEDLVQQSGLESEYTELLASAKFDFQGKSHTLSELAKYAEDPDRTIRHDAAKLRSDWFVEKQDQLDRIYDDQVALRHSMAQKLGYENYIGLGYKLMQRVDYDQSDVEVFRSQVLEHVVPLCVELKKRQALALEVDPLMAWDEAMYDPQGNPAPRGDYDNLIERAKEMFARMGGGLHDLFTRMEEQNLLDLKSRSGKAGGGFCEGLPIFGMPFIYANFNGTKGDIEVFTHEMGHAFQNYCSQQLPLSDYYWPTSESAEIHSMSLEYLTWPHMELFFGEDADRFRRIHLTTSVLFLPYGVAVDHFQHQVYLRPEATPQERCEMWQELEEAYLPWRNWGDLDHQASGRRWQAQLHIFQHPFYYIDYTLAATCALQIWLRARDNPKEAMALYNELCQRGGQAPFRQLVEGAGLKSPFQQGCLTDVVSCVKDVLAVEP